MEPTSASISQVPQDSSAPQETPKQNAHVHSTSCSVTSSCKKRKSASVDPESSTQELICEWRSCGSGFRATSDLGSHVENHIKAQSSLNSYGFRCEWKGCKVNRKSFRDSWNLIVHVRYKHTGERPWSCPCCGKTFVEQHHMRKHTISLHVLNSKDSAMGEPIFQTGGNAQLRVHSDTELTADVEMPPMVHSNPSSPRARSSDSPSTQPRATPASRHCCDSDGNCCSSGPSSPQSCPEASRCDSDSCRSADECSWSCCSDEECKDQPKPAPCTDAACDAKCTDAACSTPAADDSKCTDPACGANPSTCAKCCCSSKPSRAISAAEEPKSGKKRSATALNTASSSTLLPPALSSTASSIPASFDKSSSAASSAKPSNPKPLSASSKSFSVRIYPKEPPLRTAAAPAAGSRTAASAASPAAPAAASSSGKCEWRDCGSGFEKTDGLGEHIFDLHIKSQKARNRSLKTHGFVCEWKNCSRQKPFNSSYQLQHHIRFLHTGERPFSCPNCGSAFAQVYDLRHHQQKIHALTVSATAPSTQTPPPQQSSLSLPPPHSALVSPSSASGLSSTTGPAAIPVAELSSQTARPDSLLASIPPPPLPPQLFSLTSSAAITSADASASASCASTSVTPLHILAQSAALISKSEQLQQHQHLRH